jgi:hypothetical protein
MAFITVISFNGVNTNYSFNIVKMPFTWGKINYAKKTQMLLKVFFI